MQIVWGSHHTNGPYIIKKGVMAALAVDGQTGRARAFSRVIFDKYDADLSGAIDKDEFHGFVYAMGHYMEEEEFEAA